MGILFPCASASCSVMSTLVVHQNYKFISTVEKHFFFFHSTLNDNLNIYNLNVLNICSTLLQKTFAALVSNVPEWYSKSHFRVW